MNSQLYTLEEIAKELSNLGINEDLISNLKYFGYKINYVINKSILEGEYIEKTNIEELIEELNNCLIELKTKFGVFGAIDILEENALNFDNDSSTKYLDYFHYQINLYKLFIGKIKRLYTKRGLSYVENKIFIDHTSEVYSEYEYLLAFFDDNIELSKADHQFTSDETMLKTLFRIKNSIDSFRPQFSKGDVNDDRYNILQGLFVNLTKSLKLKVQFLIDKWYIRSKIKLKDDNIAYHNLFKSNSWIDYSLPDLRRIKEKIIYLYEIPNNDGVNILKNCFQRISNKGQILELSFFEIHTLIKYYKDFLKNKEKLKSILIFFEDKNDSIVANTYENFSFEIAKQYCQNNYFSIYCEDFEKDCVGLKPDKLLEKLNGLYDVYKGIKYDNEGLTDNFFLESKFLNYSFKVLLKCLENNGDNRYEFIKETSVFFKETLMDVLFEYDNKTNWSLKNNNYIFKLPYKESKVNFCGLNIYLSSSFLLPIDNDAIIKEKRALEFPFQRLNLLYSTINEITEIKQLKDDFKAENKRTIEVVTIFTAIVSFIMGSLGGFKFVDSIFNAIAFTLIYALCLLMFVVLILKTFRSEKIYKLYDLFPLLLVLLAIIVASLAFSTKTYITKDNIKEELLKMKVDIKC